MFHAEAERAIKEKHKEIHGHYIEQFWWTGAASVVDGGQAVQKEDPLEAACMLRNAVFYPNSR